MTNLRALLAVVLLLLGTADLRSQQQPLRVHFIDVGQGDAVLIQSPTGQNVVYDAGENPTKVRDYLIGLGVVAVGLVIASHNHADHIGGLAEVVRHFRPQFYMDNGSRLGSACSTTTRIGPEGADDHPHVRPHARRRQSRRKPTA